ncbi:MAG: glucose-6-phosphate dehydrogenase [Nitrospirae bacterium]|nr:glucose-6-phosphate dehydrogenase [Nitrospirota bacterium]
MEQPIKEPIYQSIGGCDIEIPSPFCLIIFGAYGDLAKRKLIPSLYHLYKNKLISENFFILGCGRLEADRGYFLEMMRTSVENAFPHEFDNSSWSEFAEKLYYSSLDFGSPESYIKSLKEKLSSLEKKHQTKGNRIFYLAIPSSVFETVIVNLGSSGLSAEREGYSHIIIEKPFGRDIESAKKLNKILRQYFEERQIFRIDHYIAKETIQNILMFRFANAIFEPLWNRKYIDHVQISALETLGVEHRAGYYEEAGVIRDMFQSHILQLFAITAMEPPVAFEADRVREEKIKVFRSIRPFPLDRLDEYVVIGQYGKGEISGHPVIGYMEESGVSPMSNTPTFAAMKVFIDNWRWQGVPFYLRSGKRLSSRKAEISIHFRPVPHMMFSRVMNEFIEGNILCFRIQPDEGITLSFQTKRPGSLICLKQVIMDFSYEKGVHIDAYEWVLLDCMLGDQLLFLRQEGVELTWSLLTPVLEKLESMGKLPVYEAGSSGPDEARLLIERDGRSWMPLE